MGSGTSFQVYRMVTSNPKRRAGASTMADITETAANFVRAIDIGDAEVAHTMLSQQLGSEVSVSDLAVEYQTLADDMGGVTGIGQPMIILEDWPDKSAAERAMVYVPLEGDVLSEAITVKVSEHDGSLCISSIEWGRP